MLLAVGLILAASLIGGAGCKSAPPADTSGETGGTEGGTGGTEGGTGGFALTTGEPGDGLPVALPSGQLVLASEFDFTPPADAADQFSFRNVISTLDASGTLAGQFALSIEDKIWRLSPDGKKIATYREAFDSAGNCTPGYAVYDLVAGTVTALPWPEKVYQQAPNGGAGHDPFFAWSADSQNVLYVFYPDETKVADNGADYMVSLAIAPADGSAATFKEIGYGQCAFAPLPGRTAIVFGGPNGTETSGGSFYDSDIQIYDWGMGESSVLATTPAIISMLSVSYDGNFVAFECPDDGADGVEPAGLHEDLWVYDWSTDAVTEVVDHTDVPDTNIFMRTFWWSPNAQKLAIVLQGNGAESFTASWVFFYDVATGSFISKTATPVCDETLNGATWSADGTAFYALFDFSVYKVDPATGAFSTFYASDGGLSTPPLGLFATP